MVASGGSEPILGTFTTGAQVQEYIRQNGVVIVDLRFIDLLGTVQHFSIPSAELELICVLKPILKKLSKHSKIMTSRVQT